MTTKKNIVHVVGTGTIGEPLIGLFNQFKECWGVDEVTFHKRTPSANDRAKVNQLLDHGARLATDEEARDDFAALGHRVSYTTEEAIERATVVVDCTPAGNENKSKYYEKIKGPKAFLAQGSEFGFGRPYARGINDEVCGLDQRFLQVVSCNTHNISVLLKTLAVGSTLVAVLARRRRGETLRVSLGVGIVALAIGAAVADTLAWFMYIRGSATGYATIVTALASLFSVVTVLLAWRFLRERLALHQWAGVGIILLGILLVSLCRQRTKPGGRSVPRPRREAGASAGGSGAERQREEERTRILEDLLLRELPGGGIPVPRVEQVPHLEPEIEAAAESPADTGVGDDRRRRLAPGPGTARREAAHTRADARRPACGVAPPEQPRIPGG